MLSDIEVQNNKEIIINTILNASSAILEVYNGDFEVFAKEDRSPLTEADLKANKIILEGLKHIDPSIPILSEEIVNESYSERKNWSQCWLVDPLDGTKEFINKRDEFTVNIALIQRGKPIAGFVFAPVLGELFYAIPEKGSFKRTYNSSDKVIDEFTLDKEIQLANNQILQKSDSVVIVASKSHRTIETDQYINKLKESFSEVIIKSYGSSLKLCRVAEGSADFYPRFAPTMEWDTAAAHAVVNAAGKTVNIVINGDVTSNELMYNKENLMNPWFLVK
jgi:3'(2'), 5'-bisphosphate nucleotidase